MSLIPEPYALVAKFAIVGVALAGAGFVGAHLERNAMQVKLDAVQHAWDAERAQEQAAALKATQEARAEEQRRAIVTQEVVNHAKAQTVVVAAAAGRALDALARLRERAASASDRAVSGNTPAAAGGSATSGPGLVPAELLDRVGSAAGQLGAYADQSRIAGEACDRWVDQVRAAQK